MEEKKHTIKDVAREAGVSTATVSMVISGKGRISEEKKKIVLETINRLGYKRRRGGGTKENHGKKYIGLITLCDFSFQWWFAKAFILEIKSRLLERGFYTIMFHCDHSTNPQELFDTVMNAGLSGVIALHYNHKEIFSRLVSQNMPLVLLNNSNRQTDFHTVCADDFQGAYEGTRKIIEMGHRSILFIDYHRPRQPATVVDRLFGFRKAVEEAGLPFPETHRIQVELNDAAGLVAELGRLLPGKRNITACFVHDDYFAVRVIDALKELGLRVPDDISILAPGDTLPFQEPFIPDISTMRINQRVMAGQAVGMVLSLLEEPKQPIQVVKTIERFVDRGSCRPVSRCP